MFSRKYIIYKNMQVPVFLKNFHGKIGINSKWNNHVINKRDNTFYTK